MRVGRGYDLMAARDRDDQFDDKRGHCKHQPKGSDLIPEVEGRQWQVPEARRSRPAESGRCPDESRQRFAPARAAAIQDADDGRYQLQSEGSEINHPGRPRRHTRNEKGGQEHDQADFRLEPARRDSGGKRKTGARRLLPKTRPALYLLL